MTAISRAATLLIKGVLFFLLAAFLTGLFQPFLGESAVPILLGFTVSGVIFYARRDSIRRLAQAGLSRKEIRVDDVAFHPARMAALLRSTQRILEIGKGRVSVPALGRAFRMEGVVRDVRAFCRHHWADFEEEVSDGRLDWNNEPSLLFFELMNERYRLRQRAIMALVLYVADELEYEEYRDSLRDAPTSDLTSFITEAVLCDIYTGSAHPRLNYAVRLARELGVRGSAARVRAAYAKAKKRIRLDKFASNLESGNIGAGRIADQIRSDKQLELINRRIDGMLETCASNYVVVGPDYSRESRIDRYYKAHFGYVLARAFGGLCCKCGHGMGALEFDHFWCPKSNGGNFVMRSREGVYVNNCIPLCRGCNSSKGKRDFREFLTEEEIVGVIGKSQSINAYLNQHMAEFEDPDFDCRAF